jgi:uncharacterized OsmC-like protein
MAALPSVRIKLLHDYKFIVDFGEFHRDLLVDEAEPIGDGDGPFPEQILIASVTNCLCASLVFAMGKFKQDPRGIEATSSCIVERNAEGRLRISRVDVAISLGSSADEMPRLQQVLNQFERFCTVSESVKAGVPVVVVVHDRRGDRLK